MFQVFRIENNIARYYDVFSVKLVEDKTVPFVHAETYFLIYEYRNNERWKWVNAKDYTPTNSY